MGRRRSNSLDVYFEKWARWSLDGGITSPAGLSVLAKMIEGCGVITFGGGSGSTEPLDSIEVAIEVVVMKLSITDPLTADVLRLEYAAGWWGVAKRRKIENYDPVGCGQQENATALQVSVRTYRSKLARGREAVEKGLLI